MYYSKKLYGSMSSGNLPPQEGLELWVDPSSINGNVWADKSGNGRNGIIDTFDNFRQQSLCASLPGGRSGYAKSRRKILPYLPYVPR